MRACERATPSPTALAIVHGALGSSNNCVTFENFLSQRHRGKCAAKPTSPVMIYSLYLYCFSNGQGNRRFHLPTNIRWRRSVSTETSPYSPLFPEEENQLNDKRKIAPMNARYLTAHQALATTRIVATALLVSLTSLFSTSTVSAQTGGEIIWSVDLTYTPMTAASGCARRQHLSAQRGSV